MNASGKKSWTKVIRVFSQVSILALVLSGCSTMRFNPGKAPSVALNESTPAKTDLISKAEQLKNRIFEPAEVPAAKLGFVPVKFEEVSPGSPKVEEVSSGSPKVEEISPGSPMTVPVIPNLPGMAGEPAGKLDSKNATQLPIPGVLVSGGMTLDQAINATLVADPKIRAGLEVINQANADVLTSSLKPNPNLIVSGTLIPLTRPFTPERQGGPTQMDVAIKYPIDWFVFGKRAAKMASATHALRVSQAEYEDLIRQRVTGTALAFVDVLEAKELLAVARENEENLAKVEKALSEAVKKGQRPAIEGHQVKLDLLKKQQVLREAATSLTTAKAKLRALIGGIDPNLPLEVEGDLFATLIPPPLSVPESMEVAVGNRPDIQSLNWEIAKAQADITVEKRNAYPDLTPKFGYTRQFQTPIGFPDVSSWGVELEMSLPIFNRNQGNRAKAQSLLAQSNIKLEGSLVELRTEVEQVVEELRAAYKTATDVEKEQLPLSKKILESVEKAYRAGDQPLIEYLHAEAGYWETYRLSITTRASYWRALHRFNSVMGKQILK